MRLFGPEHSRRRRAEPQELCIHQAAVGSRQAVVWHGRTDAQADAAVHVGERLREATRRCRMLHRDPGGVAGERLVRGRGVGDRAALRRARRRRGPRWDRRAGEIGLALGVDDARGSGAGWAIQMALAAAGLRRARRRGPRFCPRRPPARGTPPAARRWRGSATPPRRRAAWHGSCVRGPSRQRDGRTAGATRARGAAGARVRDCVARQRALSARPPGRKFRTFSAGISQPAPRFRHRGALRFPTVDDADVGIASGFPARRRLHARLPSETR